MKKNCILISDLHLTDNPLEAYRWVVFDEVEKIAETLDIDIVYILGDIVDRKDRHSSALVNGLVNRLNKLEQETDAEVIIIAGNHDAPLNGPYFWNFLNAAGIKYLKEPTLLNGVYLLPFSDNPVEYWRDLNLESADAIFMHQTVEGAWIDGNRKIEKAPHEMPILPRGVPIFSGDVHRPQIVGSIIYVGASHPVRFSEDWKCRAIIIKNGDFKNYVPYPLNSIRRAILDINTFAELETRTDFKKNDQIRVRFHLTKEKLTDWPIDEERIKKWAEQKEVFLASVEAILVDDIKNPTAEQVKSLEILQPQDVIRTFCESQKLDEETLNLGLELLNKAQA